METLDAFPGLQWLCNTTKKNLECPEIQFMKERLLKHENYNILLVKATISKYFTMERS